MFFWLHLFLNSGYRENDFFHVDCWSWMMQLLIFQMALSKMRSVNHYPKAREVWIIPNGLSVTSIINCLLGFVFQCGEELGETLLNISRAWEVADTSTSATLMSKLPKLVGSLTSNNKSGKFALVHSLWFCTSWWLWSFIFPKAF